MGTVLQPKWQPKDWFISAVVSNGSVSDCLDAVAHELAAKQKFINAINSNLRSGLDDGTDNLTLLGKEVKELENTLRFRLGLLRPDRDAAWFRKAGHKDCGPFRSAMLTEAVFAPYRASEGEKIRTAIASCWQLATITPIPFLDETPCLWRLLLLQKQRLNQLALLAEPFTALRLDELPDGLPADLESLALRAFLINVKAGFVSVRDRLQLCYDQLWTASEKFWQHQKLQSVQEKSQNRAKPPPARPAAPRPAGPRQASRDRPPPPPEQESQHEPYDAGDFSDLNIHSSFARMEALRFMGFRHAPTLETLRKRYLEMAKKLHPDHGGSEDAFKRLARAYKDLVKSLS